MTELSKVYEPKQVEEKMAALWEQRGCFHAEPDGRGRDRRFCIVIPPPNVTGALHLGHALNNTLQDILVRWHRMQGDNTLWMPGTDHAGIATQAIVEKRLFEGEGKTRHDLGRAALVQRIWDWKDQYEARIIHQLKLMGCSCDFARTRFTLDEGCSQAVRQTFFNLFRDGYIYRGKRLVNWDCELQTAVSDDEVHHETVQGKFYHFRYPLADGSGHLTIATTRPETMLGDTAVAVNPSDERYRHLVGKTVMLPLMNREIPIIADDWANPELGSGCVKITPAHDPNDYEVGLRHKLPMINILNPDGTLNENAGPYAGMDRFEARKAVVADLEKLALVEKIEDHEHDVGHSDRSKTQIEPYLSDQWFVKMADLAEPTLEAVRGGKVRFHPDRYKNAYLDWLSEKRDWCISRQLWWGHRIPVWKVTFASQHLGGLGTTAAIRARQAELKGRLSKALEQLARISNCQGDYFIKNFEETSSATCFICTRTAEASKQLFDVRSGLQKARQVAIGGKDLPITEAIPSNDPRYEACQDLRSLVSEFEEDPDVLDTWFSSALWPHSTLGWPGNNKTLNYYYPTSVLITSRDIITLWVVRMVLTGLYNMKQIPFTDVYVHPKILDGRGVTMSKTRGNGVDPADIIEAFGADALRWGLSQMTTETQDIRLPVEYRCPHCRELTPQTEKNMFGPDGNPSKVLACKHCKKEVATRWAASETQEQKGLALMVSDKFEAARNFANKLWNAGRFVLANLEDAKPQALNLPSLPAEDSWILAELSETIRQANRALGQYQYSRTASVLRTYFWDCLCDWYVELAKFRIKDSHAAAEARQVLAFCMDQVLRLLHPIVPFITERLWQQLNEVCPERGLPGSVDETTCRPADALAVALYPPAQGYPALDAPEICEVFRDLQTITRAVRDIRTTSGVSPKDRVRVTVNASQSRNAEAIVPHLHILERTARISTLNLDDQAPRPRNAGVRIVADLQIFVHDVVDDAKEKGRIEKNLSGLHKRIQSLTGKLNNDRYVQSAPSAIVEETRQMLAGLKAEQQSLQGILKLMS